jgi:hypothetical protein
VGAAILIENATGVVKTVYTGSDVTDPDPQVWDGTDDGGNTVTYGTYQVNITMDDGVNPMVYDNSRSIVVTNTSVAVISIGDAIGAAAIIPIKIEGGVNVGACDITLRYDSRVVNVTNVTGGDFDDTVANLEHAHVGFVRIGTYQTNNSGLSGELVFARVTLEDVKSVGGISSLNLFVNTFKDATPEGNVMPYVVRNGTYTAFLNGDVDGDGIVDIYDAMYLAKHVLGESGYGTIVEDAADVNGDGAITTHDAMCLAKHVIGMGGYGELE